jgi:hypothetical protein
MERDDTLDTFLDLSAALTGFATIRLRGTGQAEAYLATLSEVVGEMTVAALLDVWRDVAAAVDVERALRLQILSDDRLGPVARNVIKMWYVGTWYALPADWREAHATTDRDRTFVVSPAAYTEGLLWPAIGANPSGAKPLGYGMWATPPRIETV